jgi:hypothetical protein
MGQSHPVIKPDRCTESGAAAGALFQMILQRNSRLSLLYAALLACAPFAPAAPAAESGVASLDALARDTERAEALRAVKNLQYAYAHYAQFGLWAEMGALFAADGETIWGDKTFKGPAAIAKYNRDTFGAGKQGLPAGVLNTLFIDVPLVNLSPDGNSAAARWYGLHMRGGSSDARWEGGTFENQYVKEESVWKISRLHFTPQFGGPYENGMRPFASPLALVPYHFKTENEAGTPLPTPTGAPAKSAVTLASLEQRIDVLNAQDKVRNLQNAYGYYIDRKMWDDVTDLFTADGVLELGGIGIYDGPANIRRALERDGPAGLKEGQLNDHPLFDTMVEIATGGLEARVRGLELGLLGDYSKGAAHWKVSVFDNRFIKQDGVWKIREMRVFPVVKTDYYQGWGKSQIVESVADTAFAPNRPAAAAAAGSRMVPAFLRHPVTGKDVPVPAGVRAATKSRLLPAAPVSKSVEPAGSVDARIAEAARKLSLSAAYEGATNLTAAYSFYLDDGQWTSMGAIFAQNGAKQVPFNGFYIGPERIAHRPGARPAVNSRNPGSGGWHWLMQPVIDIAADGRSAKMRSRLFHPLPSATGGGMQAGMYPNNQAVLENGVWKLWSVTIDEPYFDGPFPTGWARAPAPRAAAAPAARPAPAGSAPGAPRPAAPAVSPLPGNIIYPPNIPLSVLGKRMEGFVGGTGQPIRWPGILPMWFHYKNPVSGREPERYWPNCGTCEYTPGTSMDKYGYLLP